MKPLSFSVRAESTACHARLFPLEGAGSSGRAGRGARSIFLLFLLLHRGRGAAIPAGTVRGDPRDTLGVSLPTPAVPHKPRVRPKHPRSQRAAEFGFNISGNRTEGKAQRTNTSMCTQTLFSHLPAQPCSTGSRQLFELFG